MPTSIAQSRQQLSALIAQAQQQPQVITNRNKPVAVLVSADYFDRSHAAAQPVAQRLFDRVQAMREKHVPQDDTGLCEVQAPKRQTAWQRGNAFSETH